MPTRKANTAPARFMAIGMTGIACAYCGRVLPPSAQVTFCRECGAVMCKTCAAGGRMAEHVCDLGETEDECQ